MSLVLSNVHTLFLISRIHFSCVHILYLNKMGTFKKQKTRIKSRFYKCHKTMMFNRNLLNNYNPEQTNLSPKNNRNADQSYAFIHHSL